MKRLVILGAGCAGTMVANKLRKRLDENEWSITLIDRDDKHIYQPGLLFIPFGVYTKKDVVRSRREFIGKGIDFVEAEITGMDTAKKVVTTSNGPVSYDKVIVCTGVGLAYDEIDGLNDTYNKTAFDFYSLDGAVALHEAMKNFKKGTIVMNIAEMPFKCPVAPLEFIYLADWYFTQQGCRDDIEIRLVTPLPGAFTKPKATKFFTQVAEEKNIKITPDFDLAEVDGKAKKIIAANGKEEPYDLLVVIPPNVGSQFLVDSKIAMNEVGYVRTNKETLKAVDHEDMYVVGDGGDLPTSKAGSVAHFSADVACDNFMREINGQEPLPEFDGHANCFIETGFDKAALIDFNYAQEPLPGKFPLPGIGPFSLLAETKANHWGKLMFKWIYWNKLITGEDMPIEAQMSYAGKVRD